ncbi:hypothetical protein KJ575_05245 [Patescibacteria group bacterium]|nr:hypothetical protein [Patescibacteria group bacterium]MBU4369083.1 hypothetical protein [Patescibacteria group bacterium]
MVQKLGKQDKKKVEVSLGTVINGFVKGISRLLGLAAKLEEEGKDEYMEQGEIKGKTKSGKEYKGAYGFRVKVGLIPEDFRKPKALKDHQKDHGVK